MADEVRRVADEGLPRGHVLGEPRASSAARASTATTGTRSARRARTRARSCACTSARRRQIVITSDDAPIDVMITLQPMNIVQAAADLMWSPVLPQVPGPASSRSPRAASAGSRTSSSASTTSYQHHRRGPDQDFGDKLPSQVFHEHIITLLHRRPGRRREPRRRSASTRSRGSATTRTPTRRGRTSPERAHEVARRRARRRDQQDHARERDAASSSTTRSPHRPQEQCTVGALRAESPDVDVVTRSPRQKKSNTDISSFVNTASKVLQSD